METPTKRPETGDRVILNSLVAYAFVGQRGTIQDQKPDQLTPGRTLFVVKLDQPTAAAKAWPELEVLAVPAKAMFYLTPEREAEIADLTAEDLRESLCRIVASATYGS